MRQVESAYIDMANFLGDRLSEAQRRMYELAFARHPELLIRRSIEGKNITFVHGDAYTGNFLFPKPDGSGRILLTDWQTFDRKWRCRMGVFDLVVCHNNSWTLLGREAKGSRLNRQAAPGHGHRTYRAKR
jgi:hypothetical protein